MGIPARKVLRVPITLKRLPGVTKSLESLILNHFGWRQPVGFTADVKACIPMMNVMVGAIVYINYGGSRPFR